MTVGALAGDAVQWRVEDGGNGHWYQRTEATCWSEAESAARAQGGHLASVLSAGEAQFCTQFVRSQSDGITVAIGGFRNPTSDLYLGWKWTTDETFIPGSLTWMAGNPGCCGPDEYFLGINRVGHIGDLRDCPGLVGAILEWSADCNADGIVDYGQILAGTLADTNANGIPDSCECAANPGLPACCIGDIVADRVINGADLGTLLAYWGPRTSGSFSIASDLNNDVRIDGSDLGILLAYWGACPTANVPAWATLLETQPDPAVVTDAALRTAIVATGLPWRVRDTGTGIEMLLVPPGTFQMGCTASNLSACNDDESPSHPVTLTQAFYLGRYEVTQGQWVAKMGSNPSYFQGSPYPDSANRPVEQVTWSAAQDYVRRTAMRLPSEAEWEFACRANTTTAFYNGSSYDNTATSIAWYVENSGSQTHAVGGKAANALGFFDMAGNVWEWVNDWYGSSYYSVSPSTNPEGPLTGTSHVQRGGSWYYDSGKVRSSYRITYGGTGVDFGFRVARNP
jgi:formylglycine-generating enzyme required for sulfatase activity